MTVKKDREIRPRVSPKGDELCLIRWPGFAGAREGQADAEALFQCFLIDVMAHGNVVRHQSCGVD